jgi:hypothetical protein
MMTRELSGLENPTKKQTKAVDDQWRAVSRLETQQEKSTAARHTRAPNSTAWEDRQKTQRRS